MFLTLAAPKLATVLDPLSGPSKNRDLAPHFYRLLAARIRPSQLKSLRIKQKGKSRGSLRPKLHLAGCTIKLLGRGGAWLTKWVYGHTYRYQVPGTTYTIL